jgi:hypothetical protein
VADPASRRGFLVGLLAVPAAFAGAKAVGALARSARWVRPSASGTSTTRCGQCGQSGHSMLDRRCPAARGVI